MSDSPFPSAWQTMANAPKDRPILLACADWPHSTLIGKPVPIKVGGWREDPGYWHVFGASWSPTHWMNLPDGPKVQDQDQEIGP